MTRARLTARITTAVVVAAVLVLVAGCSSLNGDLGQSDSSYVSGGGAVNELTGETDTHEAATAEQYRGRVLVVNL